MRLKETSSDTIEETPFNFAMMFYFSLNKLMEKKDEAYLSNDMNDWYKCLNRIFTKIVFKLSEGDRDLVEPLFKKARKELLKSKSNEAVFVLHKIDVAIMNFMNKYSMIFPKIDDHKGLDKLAKKYGLEEKEK